MSDESNTPSDNPYQAPASEFAAAGDVLAEFGMVRVCNTLRQTRPWVRFMSVVMFASGALMVVVGVAVTVQGVNLRGAAGLFGLVYLAMALLQLFPAVCLWRYADRIGEFLRQQTPSSLGAALAPQRSYWMFTGIVSLIVFCLYVTMIVSIVMRAIAFVMRAQ
jgi:hypothetical protein